MSDVLPSRSQNSLPAPVQEAIDACGRYYAEHHKLGMSVRDDMRYVAEVALRWKPSAQAMPNPAERFGLDKGSITPRTDAEIREHSEPDGLGGELADHSRALDDCQVQIASLLDLNAQHTQALNAASSVPREQIIEECQQILRPANHPLLTAALEAMEKLKNAAPQANVAEPVGQSEAAPTLPKRLEFFSTWEHAAIWLKGEEFKRLAALLSENVALATEKGLTPTGQHIADCERDAARYRYLREDSKDLDIEQRKASVVEIYHGKGLDEQIDKLMGTYRQEKARG